MGTESNASVFQLGSGMWAFRYTYTRNGKRVSKQVSKDENGNPLKPAQIREIGETASGGDFAEDEEFRLYLDDGTFVGIYQYRPSQNLTRPVKLFLERT